jgi:hypothetical protein
MIGSIILALSTSEPKINTNTMTSPKVNGLYLLPLFSPTEFEIAPAIIFMAVAFALF